MLWSDKEAVNMREWLLGVRSTLIDWPSVSVFSPHTSAVIDSPNPHPTPLSPPHPTPD